ncbi:hypothetical protein GQ600_6897 [Phytophthora cactorum]|nr:hypothetical protein GQ600_6897 [Phytophthora cactorum]
MRVAGKSNRRAKTKFSGSQRRGGGHSLTLTEVNESSVDVAASRVKSRLEGIYHVWAYRHSMGPDCDVVEPTQILIVSATAETWKNAIFLGNITYKFLV